MTQPEPSKPPANPRLRDLLALIAGTIAPLAYAPFSFYPLALLSAVGLLFAVQEATPKRAAWRGFLFGLGMFGWGISWVHISLHQYGNAPIAFAVIATALLVCLMAAYAALFGYCCARFRSSSRSITLLVLAPALWAGIEWLRSVLFTGFPWLSFGYSQIDGPLAVLAPVLGVFGVGWALMFLAGLILSAIQGPSRLPSLLGIAVTAAASFALDKIEWTQPLDAPVSVALVQGNVDQSRKWQPGQLRKTLVSYFKLSKDVGEAKVVVWPESAISVFFNDVEDDFIKPLEIEARERGVDFISGVLTGSVESGVYRNSIVSLGSERAFYHKRRLLPFGEFLPVRFVFDFFHRFVDIPQGDFTAGDSDQKLLQAGGYAVGTSICFEAVFGSEIRKALPEAAYLINISNDAWFADSLAPHQHFEIVRMRALEMGRDIARATNTGVSGFIDYRGRVLSTGPQFVAETFVGQVQPRTGLTPYARWGNAPVLILVTMGLLISLSIRRRG